MHIKNSEAYLIYILLQVYSNVIIIIYGHECLMATMLPSERRRSPFFLVYYWIDFLTSDKLVAGILDL